MGLSGSHSSHHIRLSYAVCESGIIVQEWKCRGNNCACWNVSSVHWNILAVLRTARMQRVVFWWWHCYWQVNCLNVGAWQHHCWMNKVTGDWNLKANGKIKLAVTHHINIHHNVETDFPVQLWLILCDHVLHVSIDNREIITFIALTGALSPSFFLFFCPM